ncbi:hypothetical protein R3Q06_36530, partial [Rhodococcus erythropolis]|uniref:hypothetical protein n=1 Tax=Rhodococcus erythropolis TaxID=1833 RepID=UPI002948E1B1
LPDRQHAVMVCCARKLLHTKQLDSAVATSVHVNIRRKIRHISTPVAITSTYAVREDRHRAISAFGLSALQGVVEFSSSSIVLSSPASAAIGSLTFVPTLVSVAAYLVAAADILTTSGSRTAPSTTSRNRSPRSLTAPAVPGTSPGLARGRSRPGPRRL